MDDNECVKAYLTGDNSALGTLFERYQNKVYCIAFQILRNSALAEDAVQDTFLRVHDGLPNYKEDNFPAWISRIVRNLSLNMIRDEKTLLRILSYSDPTNLEGCCYRTFEDLQDSRFVSEMRSSIRPYIDNLTPDHREILILRYYDDLGCNEIAEALNVPTGTVMSRLFRARSSLKKLLIENEITDNPFES